MTDAELLIQRRSELEEMQVGVEQLSKGDKLVKYRRIREIRDEIKLLESDIALASGNVSFRTKARSGGSRWL